MTRNKIAMSAIHQLQKRLQDAPEYTANEVSMIRAIQLLAPDIRAMKTRGYTMNQVAQMLTSSGIPIAATTLKSYLNRFTIEPIVKSLRRRRGDATYDRVPIGPTREPNEKQAGNFSVNAPESRSGAARGSLRVDNRTRPAPSPVRAAASPTVPAKGPTAAAVENQHPGYGSFMPREDTKDI
jgi:selenophosphate synthase